MIFSGTSKKGRKSKTGRPSSLIFRILFFSLVLVVSRSILAEVSLSPVGMVNDYAGILSPEEKASLESISRQIEQKTSAEVVIVLVKSLEGRNLEEYALEIFNTWGLGKKGKDNGVLVLVSLAERKIRIEVGYGLEEVLTDGRCGSIIRNIMAPNFRKGDYFQGLFGAVKAIGQFVSGENVEKILPPETDRPPVAFIAVWQAFCLLFGSVVLGLSGLIFQAVVITVLDVTAVLFLMRKNPSGEIFVLLGMIIPFLNIFLLLPLSSILHSIWQKKLKKTYGRQWKQYWPIWLGSSSVHWSGGGGFSSGGGGFGGGSSGGGGASGGW